MPIGGPRLKKVGNRCHNAFNHLLCNKFMLYHCGMKSYYVDRFIMQVEHALYTRNCITSRSISLANVHIKLKMGWLVRNIC